MVRLVSVSVLVGAAVAATGVGASVGPSAEQLAARLSVGQTPVWNLSPSVGTSTTIVQPQVPPGAPLGGPTPGAAAALRIEARVDRPNLTYAIGDPVMIRVRPSQDAYVTIFNTRPDGTVTVLLPNPFHRDNRFRGGQEAAVPMPQSGYTFNTICPAGVELITVVASRQPLALPSLQPTALGRRSGFVSGEISGRDLAEALPKIGIFPVTPSTVVDRPSGTSPWPGGSAQTPVPPALQAQLTASVPAATAGGVSAANLLIQVQERPGQPCPPAGSGGQQAMPPSDLPLHLIQLLSGAGMQLPALMPPTVPGAVRVQTERAVYRPGQPVHVLVSVNRACRLGVFHVRGDGQTTQMFPNPQQPDPFVQAGELRLVPPTDAPQRFVAGGRGNESVIAVCEDPTQAPAVQLVPPTGSGWNPSLGGFQQVVQTNRIGIFASGSAAPGPIGIPALSPAASLPANVLDRSIFSYSIEPGA